MGRRRFWRSSSIRSPAIPEYIDWAQRLYGWTVSHLRSPQGVYWDSIDRTGRIDKAAYTYNSGIMIQAGLLLYQETGDERYLRDAKDLARSSLEHFASGPLDGKLKIFPPTPWFNAVLFRSYLALHEAVGDNSYAFLLLSALEYGWTTRATIRASSTGIGVGGPAGGRAISGCWIRRRWPRFSPWRRRFALPAARGCPTGRGCPSTATASSPAPGTRRAQARPVLSPMGTLGNCRRFKERGIYAVEGVGEIVLTGRVYTYYEQHGGPAGNLGFPLMEAEAAPASPSVHTVFGSCLRAAGITRRRCCRGSRPSVPAR